jgi:hypothetical protein
MPSLLDLLMQSGGGTEGNSVDALQTAGQNPILQAFIRLQAQRAKDAVTAPRDAYTGDLQVWDPATGHTTEKAADRASGMAGFAMGGGGLAGIPEARAAAQAGDAMLGIVPLKVAQRLDTPRKLPTDPLALEAIANTPGATLTDDGLQMMLRRFQKPEQAGEESVRTGVFYLPDGAAQMKNYRGTTGEGTYGGREAISGETQLNAPLVVKGATGGKAPEAAYNQINGKGAYDAMRSEALASTGGWNTPKHLIEEKVEAFLEKHAPDLMGSAYQIMQNSKGGNLLPYALQEAAVAHAVRNAGHDAVVGVSKVKGKPALSEVFDVRESHYPTPDGGFELMPQFKVGPAKNLGMGVMPESRK